MTGIHPSWERFTKLHPANPFLDVDPLYALDGVLIDRLKTWEILTPTEVKFEQDLLEATAGGGFHKRIPFIDPLSLNNPSPEPDIDQDEDSGLKEASALAEIDRLFEPYTPAVRTEWARAKTETTVERQRAYITWLVCDKTFQAERDALRKDMDGWIDQLGYFPEEEDPQLTMGNDHAVPQPTQILRGFYRRWGLQKFITWELPLPGSLELLDPSRMSVSSPGKGLTLTIPWYALRDKRFNLDAEVEELIHSDGVRHLQSWFGTRSKDRPVRKYQSLENQYWLYRYLHLGVLQRYGSRLRKKTEQLDNLCAVWLGCNVETVRKQRQDLFRGL